MHLIVKDLMSETTKKKKILDQRTFSFSVLLLVDVELHELSQLILLELLVERDPYSFHVENISEVGMPYKHDAYSN